MIAATKSRPDIRLLLLAESIAEWLQRAAVQVVLPESVTAPGRRRVILRATMAVKIDAPGARVYEYYDPDCEDQSAGARLMVTARR